jgi:signal transduction histidine kinase
VPAARSKPTEVFINLLTNAAAAIDGDGQITVTTSSDDTHVIIAVSDTGAPISDERLACLFEPAFVRSEGRVRAELGMFVCRDVVSKHGSEIRVETGEAGSTLTVVLPIESTLCAQYAPGSITNVPSGDCGGPPWSSCVAEPASAQNSRACVCVQQS